MHRIDSLEIAGFKSFRNKVAVRFPGDISSIVGPNGCGKSNICDAFLWVLGEQSARVLRGNRMEDVIFNGTQRYGPVGFAEVTLRLKYQEGGDDDDTLMREDIEISRRLYRDGASEYFLNGRRCRLLDIQEAFEGTGLGFTSYAIIEQGRIHNLLASKPSDKRALIEEAAKIVSFKHRKKSALLKLEMAQNNLLRIRDIIAEIERNLKSLKVQVQRARRYRHLREQMRRYLKIRHVLEGRHILAGLDRLHGEIRGVDEALHAAEAAGQESQQGLAHERETLTVEEQKLRQLQLQENNLQLHLQRITQSQDFLRQQRAGLEERSGAIQSEQAQLDQRRQEREKGRQELEEKIRQLEEVLAGAQTRYEATEQRFLASSSRLEQEEQKLEELRRLVFEEAAQTSEWKNQETQFVEQQRWLQKQRKRLEDDLVVYGNTRDRLRGEVRRGEQVLDDLVSQIEQLESRQEELRAGLEEMEGRKASFQQQILDLEKEVNAQRHRLRSLEELEARNEFYSDTLKKILPQIAQDEGFRGTLADFFEAGPGYHPVVESFLRTELEAVVTDSETLLEKGVDLVQQLRGGSGQFLLSGFGTPPAPEAAGDPSGRPGVVGRLESVLQPEPQGLEYLRRAMPGIRNVWLVADRKTALEVARETPGVTCLALDGVAVSASGRVAVYGAAPGKGILGYRHEKKDLTQRVKAGDAELDRLHQSLAEVAHELEGLEDQFESAGSSLQEYRLQRVRFQEEGKRQTDELMRFENLIRTAELELGNVATEESGVQAELDKISGQIRQLEENRAARQDAFEACRQEISRLKEETARLNSEYTDMKTEFLTARERLGAANSESDQNRQALDEIGSRVEALAAEQASVRQRLEQITQEAAAFDARFREAVDQQTELRGRLAGQEELIGQCRVRIQAAEAELELRRQAVDAQREHKNRLEVEKARLDNEIAHLEEGAVTEFHQTLRQLVEDPAIETEDLDAEAASKRYLEYREKTEKMGGVNLLAVEEYEREEERLTFHQAQEQDIAESIVSTQKGIEEIDRRSARLFKDTFEQVNQNFQDMFQVLFGGGFCELRLVDEENLLESGVDIVASPPGKKLQNLLLLSGGEKALTALALLLAIFKYRPSPFCILDEVDAPLDESNIDRFVNLTKQMSDQTQFVLITHNKRTMEIADSIYGITMEEAGISKVLSVQLKDVESVLSR